MKRIKRSERHRAHALPKHRIENSKEILELREENKRLRELVAQLSKMALGRIVEAFGPGARSVGRK